MHRSWLLVLGLLIISALGFGQSTSSDSQSMQALVAEVRQLRKDLQTSNGYALKAQILLYRLQFQEAIVARVSQHLNDERSKLAQTQEHRRAAAARLKQWEESLDNTEISSEDRKRVQAEISANKQELERVTPEEQQRQAAEMEAEEQLRVEQAKLGELEDRIERLEKDLGGKPQ